MTRTLGKLVIAMILGALAAVATWQLVGHQRTDHRPAARDNADPGLIP